MNDLVYISNLQPDPQDERDYLFQVDENVILPDSVNLYEEISRHVEDQLHLNSCTGNALVSICEMYLAAAGLLNDTPETDDLDLSRLFNYRTSRTLIGGALAESDSGSTARMALRAAKNFGICRESVWPYDPGKVNSEPSPEAYADAEKRKIGAYYRIPSSLGIGKIIWQIKYALAKGWPVYIGLRIGETLRDLKPEQEYSYVHPLINPHWGNHQMWIYGYGPGIENFLTFDFENSWGKNWCNGGRFRSISGVPAIDMIDIWVVCGFAGIERVGRDRTIPKPAPAPAPVPVPPPAPEPLPEPPKPEPIPPQPDPVPVPPAPVPEKKDRNGALIAGVVVAALILLAASQWA